MYNINYTIKNIGYFQNYIYKYKDFLINKNLLDPFLLKDKSYIIYICLKNGIEYNLTGICYFIEYIQFISLLNESLNDLELKLNIKSNEINTIIIKIWMFKEIAAQRKAEKDKKEFIKKLIKFQKTLEKLIIYKVNVSKGSQEYSRFLTDKILTKELKPVLHIKIIDEDMQAECLTHLLNLMSKKWENVPFDKFKYWMYKTIKLYQDNYEQNDMWELEETSK